MNSGRWHPLIWRDSGAPCRVVCGYCALQGFVLNQLQKWAGSALFGSCPKLRKRAAGHYGVFTPCWLGEVSCRPYRAAVPVRRDRTISEGHDRRAGRAMRAESSRRDVAVLWSQSTPISRSRSPGLCGVRSITVIPFRPLTLRLTCFTSRRKIAW